MVRESVTLEQLDRVLGQLGFSRQVAPPKWIWYEHASSGTVIVLPDQKLGEPVGFPDWNSARVHLIEKGLVNEEQLEPMLSLKSDTPNSSRARKRR